MALPEWLIYRLQNKGDSLEIRKLNGNKEVGIIVTKRLYEMPGEIHAEYFITRENAKELIKSLQKYFKI